MSNSAKAAVTIVLIAVMGFAFWMMNYQPKQKEILSLYDQIAEQRQKEEEYEMESKNLAQWEQARIAFQQVLQKLHQTGPMKDFIPSFLTDIEKLAHEEQTQANDPSFRVTSVTPGNVTQESAVKSSAPQGAAGQAAAKPENKPAAQAMSFQTGKSVVQLNFTGRFSTIVDFLNSLGNFKLNKLVTIQRITLAPQGGKAGLSPVLTVTMPFEVYMLGGGT